MTQGLEVRGQHGATVDEGRRGFLRGLLGTAATALAGSALAPAKAAAQVAAREADEAWVATESFFVAGYQHHDGPRVQARIRPGSVLHAWRQPDNRHDGDAIALRFGRAMVGYVPRRRNRMTARLLDGGFAVRYRVKALHADAPAWERLEVVEEVCRVGMD
jgi:hypothetical protein